jgi:tRNA(Ile2) C34 agmatinyltransferase TiaS
MLEKKSHKTLKWLHDHNDQPYTEYQMSQKGFCPDPLVMEWLAENKYVTRWIPEDDPYLYGDNEPIPYEYRINPAGELQLKACRREIIWKWIPDIISNTIALAALVVSIIALINSFSG